MLNIKFKTHSKDPSENEIVLHFAQHIAEEHKFDGSIEIIRIEEKESRTPDFYLTGLDALVEIKGITESHEEMSKVSSVKFLNEINEIINSRIGKVEEYILVEILNSTILRNRGPKFKKLIEQIIKDITSGVNFGMIDQYSYRITRNSEFQTEPYVIVSYAGFIYPTVEGLSAEIDQLLTSGVEQLVNYEMVSPKLKILLLNHEYTYLWQEESIVESVKRAIDSNKEIVSKIDYIYIKIKEKIFKIVPIK
ncbi:hypothetical protein [Leptospira kmetyi]|uniref:hypothetical protein n=1 Tax=Leptospira kmetyi TaxID=408139 RepID=UPI003EB991F1